ncbi:MAG: Dam family site-specific DNA-(adenine-N6)-methyltransferase [Tissierellales bacterium]|nr:Dam family site-specific DNA-(adenine-N6)-methyltransferase [Tissierellales bacterium]
MSNVQKHFKGISPSKKPPPQLLKWIGNKQRYAPIITSFFPDKYNKYVEPFMGTGAVLATMSPKRGIAGDLLEPLIEIMKLLKDDFEVLVKSYEKNWSLYQRNPKVHYDRVKQSFNKEANALDLLFLSRTCYGGVVRFTKEGKMSTPLGPHNPISPETFRHRATLWRERVSGTDFYYSDYRRTMDMVEKNDIVYCDPPYVDSQSILYGAQSFRLEDLIEAIAGCVKRGAKVALSIDGIKKSGKKKLEFNFPDGLFQRELFINNGSSMLRRFQKSGETMEGEDVKDRLLLTW